MEKFKLLLKSRKNIVILLIVFVAFLACVLANLHTKYYTVDVKEYFTNTGSGFVDIHKGDVLEQEFILEEGTNGVAVLFTTYGTEITWGKIQAEVFHNEKLLDSCSVATSEIQDNSYINFVFDKTMQKYVGEKCKLKLSFHEIGDQQLAVYVSDSDSLACSFEVNEAEYSGDLVAKGIKEEAKIRYRDIRYFYIFVFVCVIGTIAYKTSFLMIKNKLFNVIESLKRFNKRKLFLPFVLLIICGLLTSVMEYFMMQEKGYINPYRWFMFIVFFSIISFSIAYRNYIWKHVHRYIFVVILLIGLVAIVSLPVYHISWDEQIHFNRTAYMSWGAKGQFGIADYGVSTHQGSLDKVHREESIAYVNTMKDAGIVERGEKMEVSFVAYVAPSILMYIGRALGFSVYGVYMLGKVANLFCYATFLALAIRNFEGRGKLIATALGLVPVCIFVSVSYSYDWWVISLAILGFSIFIGEIQRKGKISNFKLLLSVGVTVLGLLSKAVYFPMMLPMMLLRKEKYENSKVARGIVIAGMLFLLATFILPILLSGAGQGDLRGGSDVNSSGQIAFILGDIPGYIKIMFDFFRGYLSLDNVHHYLGFLAYFGFVDYISVVYLIIVIATIIDNTELIIFRKNNHLLRIGNLIGVFGAIVLVATALYVAFTPVGHYTINGCQFRYLLPVLFPVLFFTGEYDFKVSDDVKQKFFILEVIVLVFIFLNGWYKFAIIHY